MATQLNEIQISLIWAEAIINGFVNGPNPQPPLAFLKESTQFIPFFDKAQQQAVPLDGQLKLLFHPPWRKPTGQRFWQAYLENEPPATVNGKRAWRSLVPLRAELPFKITAPSTGTKLQLEAFFYPYGLAAVATATISGSFGLEDAIDAAIKVRRSDRFTVEWSAQKVQSLTLQQLADPCLTLVRSWGWGKDSAGKRTGLDPFTICSITQGKVENPTAIVAGSDVHRALEAMAGWRPNWKTEPLGPIDDARVSAHAAAGTAIPAIDWVYGRKRGRAVWIPSRLTLPGGYPLSLECYHHNLTYASLQVESLCGFARETVARSNAGALTFYEKECARNAAGLLTRLYAGHDSVYRTWSVRLQIDQNNFRPVIDDLRKVVGLPP